MDKFQGAKERVTMEEIYYLDHGKGNGNKAVKYMSYA